jgi:hypothetical protein
MVVRRKVTMPGRFFRREPRCIYRSLSAAMQMLLGVFNNLTSFFHVFPWMSRTDPAQIIYICLSEVLDKAIVHDLLTLVFSIIIIHPGIYLLRLFLLVAH